MDLFIDQVDPEVFAALPSELQEELRQAYDQRQKHVETIFQQTTNTTGKSVALVLSLGLSATTDSQYFSFIRNGWLEVYFLVITCWMFFIVTLFSPVSKNPLLNLKLVMKNKKKNRKKGETSPVKKSHSPLKNKLFGSPAKNMSISGGSPQKLIDDYLKQEESTTGNSQVTFSQMIIWLLSFLFWVLSFQFRRSGRKSLNNHL